MFSEEKCKMDTCGMACLTKCYYMDYSEEKAKEDVATEPVAEETPSVEEVTDTKVEEKKE